MQDLLDASIPAVVLIPLLIVFFAVWRCFRWIVQSHERSRAEFLRLHRLAKEEQQNAERDHEQGYGTHQEYLRQRPGAQQRQVDDYRVDYRSQPVSQPAGYDYSRRVQLEQDYRYFDSLNYPTRQDEENMRRRRWDEEKRHAEAEEFRLNQAVEYNRRKQAEVEELRRMQARAEEAERMRREAAEAELRRIKRLAEEAEIKRIAEEEVRNRRQAEEEERRKRQAEEEDRRRRQAEEEERRRRQAEEEERKRRLAEEEERRRRQAEVDEINKKAELESRARKLAEEEETMKKKADESIPKGTQVNKVYAKLQSSSNLRCIVCQKQTKRRCSRCKSVFYCSRECQVQHWTEGHKYDCRTLESSSSPGSSESGARKFSDLLSPRSSRSDEIIAPSLSPALSPAPSPAPSPGPMYNNSAISHSAPVSPRPGSLLKTSSIVSADGRRLKPKKILFPYGDFLELFNTDISFIPCGLINCGNSCFANAVLQCLTYTQPLVAYLLRGDHRRHCRSGDWCFMCALQEHAVRVKQLRSAFSPVDIVSHLRNIGRGLGYGKQEDAHEFMSYAIHLMQNICLDEVGGEKAVDACTQETTLIHHIFGGLLQSQVRCMECRHESNMYEIIMDLAVEIQGNVGSLEDALRQFTAPEILDGENKYKCDWCDAYVEARKQITVHEAPNILIVTLKRFKVGRFGKLNKQVAFSDVLDMTPYMSENGDRPPMYTLYAVVVHVDVDALNAAYYGHYICLVKNPSGYWYRVDDPKVTEVDIYRVTSQQAYMLLYKRSNLRPMDFTENTLCQGSPLAQEWIVSNSFEVRPEHYQFPLHMNPLVSSTRTDRTDFIHVPIGVSNCC